MSSHLAGCEGCRRWAAEMASTEWLLSEALQGAAARRDFAPFLDGVMARVEAARPVPFGERVRRAMRLHPRLIIGGALAPVVLALALGLYLQTGGGRTDFADASQLEVSAEGGATTIIQSPDGPLVLIDDDDEET
jgi:hypothetical protein